MAELKFTDIPSRLVGYVRVSTVEQETALQLAAMRQAGVAVIFEEKRSSVADRPVLRQCLSALRPSDVLCVYKIDRLARSLLDLMGILQDLAARGCAFRSLTEPVETATPAGRLMVQILGSFAEFERAVIRERCAAGRQAAQARGVRFGRPPLVDAPAALAMRQAGASWSEVGARFGVAPSSARLAVRYFVRGGRAAHAHL